MRDRGVHHGNSPHAVQEIGTGVQSSPRGHEIIHQHHDLSANRFIGSARKAIGTGGILSAVLLSQAFLLVHEGVGTRNKLGVTVATSASQCTAEPLGLIKAVFAFSAATARWVTDENGRCSTTWKK
jgi:hypothetical protein